MYFYFYLFSGLVPVSDPYNWKLCKETHQNQSKCRFAGKQAAAAPDHLGLWGQQSAENLSSPIEQFRAEDIYKIKVQAHWEY